MTARIIAGFGRSGTTWVQDVLAEANGLRAVFEPLHPLLIPGASEYAHRYLAAGDEDPVLYRILHRFICEDYHSLWVDYRVVDLQLYPRRSDFASWRSLRNRLSMIATAGDNIRRFRRQRRHRERITKFVRANMLLSWLHRNFGARIVFVIRHPAAVVMSQMNAPGAWDPYGPIGIYRKDERLLANLDARSKSLLFGTLTKIEAYTLSWCIENSVGLRQVEQCGGHVVFYERLLEHGEPEWRQILSALELPTMPDARLIERPSQQAWGRKAADPTLVRQYASWMSRIDETTSAQIQRILDATGMRMYSVTEALPRADA